jgi:hypothetical protein
MPRNAPAAAPETGAAQEIFTQRVITMDREGEP